MNRMLYMLVSIWLSLTLVLTGSGVAFTHCAHSGKVKLTILQTNMGKHCQPTQSCMNVTVVKPTPVMGQAINPLSISYVAVTPTIHIHIPQFIPVLRAGFLLPIGEARHGPPRHYLNLLRTLLI